MKKIKLFVLSLFVFALMPLFSACSNTASLGTPQNLLLDNNTYALTWDAVKDADYYGVEINGKIYQTASTNFSVAGYVMESGVYQIRVAAFSKKADVKNSEFTENIVLNKKDVLAAPKLSYNADTGELSWDNVQGAYYYNFNVNGVDFLTTETSFNIFEETAIERYLTRGKVNRFYVYCPATSSHFASSFSKEINVFVANLQNSPLNLNVVNDNDVWMLTFDRVSTANTYTVAVNDKILQTQSNTVDISMFIKSFGKYQVTVRAGEVYDQSGNLTYMASKSSETYYFEIVPSFVTEGISDLTIDENKLLTFNPVEDASVYQIKITDENQLEIATKHVTETSVDLSNLITQAKFYEVTVIAKNGEYQSLPSSIRYKNIIKLTAPDFEIEESESSREVLRHLNITTDYSKLGIQVEFNIYFQNNLLETLQTNIEISNYLQAGSNTISIQAVCNNEFYVNSEISEITYNYYVA